MESFRWIFESGHMVDSLGAQYGVIFVFTSYLHCDATFGFSNSGISLGYATGTSAFIVGISIFGYFPFSGCNC